ncbi:MAG: hypothetical protein AAFZ09_03005, partial [Pseudomonadota bacterium]
FALLKAVHELGHAVALIRAAAGEGVPLGPIRAGIAFFALVPFPYTDATAAWKLRSRWRRAGVGLAGVFVESWIAAAVAILMLQIAPGPLQTFLAQILVVAGLSTLLFNLNPLVRLDGYYVLCDLARQPNLATRATLAARETALGLLGADRADERRGDGRGPGFIAYWLLSYAYRWAIFAGIFWLAYGIDPRLAWGVAALALSLLVVRPLIGMATTAHQRGIGSRRLVLGFGVLAASAACLAVPIPRTHHVEGHLSRHDVTVVRATRDARVEAVAPRGGAADAAGPAVMVLENPVIGLRLAELEAERALIEGRRRAANEAGAGAAASFVLAGELDDLDALIAETETDLGDLRVTAGGGAVWEPREARRLEGAWVAAGDNRVMGRLVTPGATRVVLRIAQDRPGLNTMLAPGTAVAFRPVVNPGCVGGAVANGLAPVEGTGAEGFHAVLTPAPGEPCIADLPEGAAVVARLVGETGPLAGHVLDWLERLAQDRLPRDGAGR